MASASLWPAQSSKPRVTAALHSCPTGSRMRASLAGFVLTVDCDRCASPPDQAGRPGQCPPLQDPDGEGGVDVSQCRGIAIGHTCEARCDANTGYTGHPTRYTCGGDGETWGWRADTTYPVCTSSHTPPAPPPPPPPGGGPELVDFVHPIVNVMGTGGMGTGMEGYSTFQLALAFSSSDVANVYAIYGAPAVTSGPEAGTAATVMTIPPAFQSGVRTALLPTCCRARQCYQCNVVHCISPCLC